MAYSVLYNKANNRRKGNKMKTKTMTISKIETKEDMINWANAVNSGMTISEKCDYQDIFAHSNIETINTLFMEMNRERRLILSSVYNTMAYETVESLLLHYAKTKGNKIVNDTIEDQMNQVNQMRLDVYTRENRLKDCLKGYWKRIKDLRTSNEELKRREASYLQQIDSLRTQLRHAGIYKVKSDKYDAIKGLLA